MRIGKYELLCELASGGMGVVHVARLVGDAGFSRLVVIKRLHAHLAREPEFRNMVRDEANLASQIHHPNVVPVIDVVEQGEEVCLVLEYVASVSLSSLLKSLRRRSMKLPAPMAARIMSDVLSGLHAAHEVNDVTGVPLHIVHRDVSPQNVIIGVDGSARLIDFGVAKATVRHARTKSGELKGKLSYMSPEQIQRKPVDRRSDVFAAGAVLYEALSGAVLFDGPDEGAILLGILMGTTVELPEAGPAVEALIDRAVTASVDDRYPTARAFREALEDVIVPSSPHEVAQFLEENCGAELEERQRRIQTVASSTTARSIHRLEDAARDDATRPTVRESRPRRRAMRPRVIAGGILAALLLAGVFVTVGARSARDAASTPPSVVAKAVTSDAPAIARAPSADIPTDAPSLPSADAPAVSASSKPARHASPAAPKPARTTGGTLRKNPYR